MNKASSLRIFFLLITFVIAATSLSAQNCIVIESILADACGTPEGENEMVRFKTGTSPVNISSINVNWPNNTFLGISPVSPTTNAIVNSLNSTIISCGYLVQPVGGLIPAGKTVLLVTSTNISLSANSFANLSDTLYVIFQNAGNTAGHFVNYSATPGLRTLSITAGSPACTDAVTYDRSLLINQAGGFGGSSAQNDGATIEFTPTGTATYINNGCQAPIDGITADAGNNSSMCQGGTVSLTGTATGNYTDIFWQGGQGSFSSPGNLNTNYIASPIETGSIILSLGVVGNCSDTIISNVTISITPQPAPIISLSGSSSICQGNSVTLTASGGTNYAWSTGAAGNSITVVSAGTYSVTVTNSCGSGTATQNITVTPTPAANITSSGSSNFCAGDSVTLYASGTGNYSWSNGSNADSITVYNSGTYTLQSSNACGTISSTQSVSVIVSPLASISAGGSTSICPGTTLILTASGGGSYLWNTGAATNSISVSAAGTYSVTASNACGSSTASQSITLTSLPAANINSSSNSFCTGSSLLLYATGNGNFTWSGGITNDSINITSGGSYTLTALNSCGSASDNIVITQLPLPAAVITPSGSTTLCPGSTVNLSASGGNSYLWAPSGSSAGTITVSNAGTYTLTATNSCGSDNAIVTINSGIAPSTLITPSGNTDICEGETIQLSASGGTNYLWSTGQTGSSLTVSNEGIYWVSASNDCGTDTAYININVDSVTAYFTASTVSGIYPLEVDFSNNSSLSAVSFGWNSGNGNISNSTNFSTIYNEPGTYSVTLTANNSQGCQDTYAITIIVYAETSFLQVPNVFTPNNDGINDEFGAIGYQITEFTCSIYDRWGILISEMDSVNKKWDGRTTAGLPVSDGTYFYILKAKGAEGRIYDTNGFVQLIRK
ncbi:MAG: hypothetical protein K0S44_2566 [Bacteroidetes bacterium]|jgi:gliding motility-associated-like protein|nr:hypothetical protein [Bacteroidota bacterium]